MGSSLHKKVKICYELESTLILRLYNLEKYDPFELGSTYLCNISAYEFAKLLKKLDYRVLRSYTISQSLNYFCKQIGIFST